MHISVIDILCGRHKIQVYTIWVEGLRHHQHLCAELTFLSKEIPYGLTGTRVTAGLCE